MDLATNELFVQRAPKGKAAELIIGDPPLFGNSIVVGLFHTHPNPRSEGWDPGPGDADRFAHEMLGLPGLIRSEEGVHTVGPACRRGGVVGGPGYPP